MRIGNEKPGLSVLAGGSTGTTCSPIGSSETPANAPAPSIMIDWATTELPDPVGIPINSGQMMSVSQTGCVEWATAKRLSVPGSWASNMTFRAIGASYTDDNQAIVGLGEGERQSGLEISGNPAKFLNGHNLFGSNDLHDLLARSIDKARSAIWPDLFETPRVDLSAGTLSRIDLTGSWLVDRPEDVLPTLRAMEERVWCPYRGRGVFDAGGSTLYYGRAKKGGRAKDWAIKIYWKGAEVGVPGHKLPPPAYEIPGLFEELNRTIRVELTLRTPELRRLGLDTVGAWTPAIVSETWERYVQKLDFGQTAVNLDTVDLAKLGLKARHADALAAWQAGNDIRANRSRASFYRLAKELRDLTGIDVRTAVPKSNVVPLRRLVTVSPALHPRWADQLTAALGVAA